MAYSLTKIKNLFLRQSYIDAWEEYEKILRAGLGGWDYVILTASNEAQARTYRIEIRHRLGEGRLPANSRYEVLPDPEGKRVGSGGATFHVLRFLAEQEGTDTETCLRGKKVLVIHSGGDSRRVPQYSVCGKLFSPVPRQLPDGNSSTLFDEFMISMTAVAGRIREGMLVLSGDVLLLFNSLQLDFQFQGAAAISIKEPVTTGKEHGVFLRGETGMVRQFLHKKSEEQLRSVGAVNEQDCVDLDTGAVLLDCQLLSRLFELISTDGKIDEKKYEEFVNEQARISFYGDFLYPLAKEASLEDYLLQAPEGSFCQELTECRRKIWRALSDFSMKVICLSPAEFIHFGTTGELLSLVTDKINDYEFLDWKRIVCSNRESNSFAAHNSFLCPGAAVESGCYLEDSFLGEDVKVKQGAILSGVSLYEGTVPEHTVVHTVRLMDGSYVARVYGVHDNPKGYYEENTSFLQGWLKEMLDFYGILQSSVWQEEPHILWTAELYPVCSTPQEAVAESLILTKMAKGEALRSEVERWLSHTRSSLAGSFRNADVEAVLPWRQELKSMILADCFVERLCAGEDYRQALALFGDRGPQNEIRERLLTRAAGSDFKTAMRIYYALGMEQECFAVIKDQVFESVMENRSYDDQLHIVCDQVRVELPLRVNWGGGWTDTPPYCNEQGGMVLNAAIKLNHIFPVQVEVRRLSQKHVEFESADLNVSTIVDNVEEIQDCMDPYDFFALHKAALTACGIIPMAGAVEKMPSLEEILDRMGGGIYLSTRVTGVPKGSGLGTSSILAGACAKAIAQFTGKEAADSFLFEQVLCMEQIMSTGGGWQDQAGGLTKGIKMITSRPGVRQLLHVEYLKIPEEAQRELQERFAIVYTGQRRLARNLLREVVGNYIGGRKESVDALKEMKETAILMKAALERGDIDELASLFNHHWELSLKLDGGATNLCIDQIFMTIEDLIDGRFIAGAGGGGFLQIIMKKGVTRSQVNERLNQVFQGTGAAVWDSEFIF